MNKKGVRAQIAIFVIIAIVIIFVIAFIFLFAEKPFGKINPKEDPQGYIGQCIQPSLESTADELIKHAGYMDPSGNYILYQGQKIAYLCYTQNDMELCLNMEPVLAGRIEKEIYNEIQDDVNTCFESLKKELREFDYEESPTLFSVDLKPGKILVEINKTITISKEGQVRRFEVFMPNINSPMFDFVKITNKIINQEVNCNCQANVCNADWPQISVQHPEFKITRPYNEYDGEIYMIEELLTEKQFKFAIRNCIEDLP